MYVQHMLRDMYVCVCVCLLATKVKPIAEKNKDHLTSHFGVWEKEK